MTDDIVIRVENLSKLYHLGELHKQTNSFRDKVTQSFRQALSKMPALWNAKPIPPGPSAPGSLQSSHDDYIWALKDISFKVKQGEVLGIIGRNGAGKSTLLKILSRITLPTKGYAEINGRVSSLLEVGTGFHPELTGRENIYLNGAILGMKKAEIKQKFDEIVAFAEIEKFMDTPVKRYSSGMYVRLAFAVAAHLEPEILLVDEVLAVGDANFQKKCLGKMDKVAKEGRTVLFVSHNMGAVGRLCDRCILLDGGGISEEGNPKQVINSYLSDENSTKADVQFPNDVKKTVQIRRIYMLNHNNQPALELDRTKPFRLVIEIEAHKDAPNGEVGVSLETLEGVTICDSVSADEMERYIRCKAGEVYIAKVEFPGGFLNAGSYRLSVNVVSNHIYQDKQYFPTFRLVNMGEFGSYVGASYPGIMLVKAKWEVDQKNGQLRQIKTIR